MVDPSPWCPTCSNRKGHTIVCDACWQRLPERHRASYDAAVQVLDDEAASCIGWLRQAAGQQQREGEAT